MRKRSSDATASIWLCFDGVRLEPNAVLADRFAADREWVQQHESAARSTLRRSSIE